MTDKTIILSTDEIPDEIYAGPPPLLSGSLVIESEKGNPDATVNLPGFTDVYHVEEGDKLEQKFNQPTTKGE